MPPHPILGSPFNLGPRILSHKASTQQVFAEHLLFSFPFPLEPLEQWLLLCWFALKLASAATCTGVASFRDYELLWFILGQPVPSSEI